MVESQAIHYSRLKKQSFKLGEFELVTIREQDMEQIRQWRNAQIEILRQKAPISPEQQKHYFQNILQPEFPSAEPKNMLFSLFRNGNLIGYGALVHIDWEFKRGEISFLLNPEFISNDKVYSEIFLHFLKLLQEIAFEDLGFHRIYAETYKVRETHMKTLEAAGLKFEGEMIDHVIVEGKYVNSIIHGLVRNN